MLERQRTGAEGVEAGGSQGERRRRYGSAPGGPVVALEQAGHPGQVLGQRLPTVWTRVRVPQPLLDSTGGLGEHPVKSEPTPVAEIGPAKTVQNDRLGGFRPAADQQTDRRLHTGRFGATEHRPTRGPSGWAGVQQTAGVAEHR